MTIHLRTYGQGPALVFFHGWGFDSTIWHPLLPQLMNEFQVFLVDLPGFGFSKAVKWSSFKNKMLPLLPKQFALAGWSLGGLYATRLALEAPDRVTHLLNITSTPRFVKDATWPGIERCVLEAFDRELTLNVEQVMEDFAVLQLQEKREQIAPSNYTKQGLQSGLNSLLHEDFRSNLARLTIPVCYLFGRLDKIVPHHTLSVMKKWYPQFEYALFRRAAHVPFLSQQHDFLITLKDFIR